MVTVDPQRDTATENKNNQMLLGSLSTVSQNKKYKILKILYKTNETEGKHEYKCWYGGSIESVERFT